MKYFLYSLIAVSIAVVYPSTEAADRAPVWMDRDVLEAAQAIDMDDDQLIQFREVVSVFLNQRVNRMNELMQSDSPDIDRKIELAIYQLVGHMNEGMAVFLTAEQLSRYEVYRDVLMTRLANR